MTNFDTHLRHWDTLDAGFVDERISGYNAGLAAMRDAVPPEYAVTVPRKKSRAFVFGFLRACDLYADYYANRNVVAT